MYQNSPMAQFANPYFAMNGNPVSTIDPTGGSGHAVQSGNVKAAEYDVTDYSTSYSEQGGPGGGGGGGGGAWNYDPDLDNPNIGPAPCYDAMNNSYSYSQMASAAITQQLNYGGTVSGGTLISAAICNTGMSSNFLGAGTADNPGFGNIDANSSYKFDGSDIYSEEYTLKQVAYHSESLTGLNPTGAGVNAELYLDKKLVGKWDVSSGTSSGLSFSDDVNNTFSGAGLFASMVETAAEISHMQPAQLAQRGLDLAKDAKILGKIGNVAGHVGTGISVVAIGYQFATNHDNTSTWVDAGVTVTTVALGIGFGTVAAVPLAVGGLFYGVWAVSGGSDWIDNNWGYRKP